MNLKNREFEKSSLLLFALMMLGNVLNYVYQVIMGNMLSVEDFGILTTVLSLSTLAAFPCGILQLIATRNIARYAATDRRDSVSLLIFKLLRIGLVVALLMLASGVLLSPWIGRMLNVKQSGYIRATMAIIPISFATSILNGALQGLKRFMAYGLYSVIASLAKLVGCVALVLIGFGIYGNIFGLGFSILAALVFCLIMLREYLHKTADSDVRLDTVEIKSYFKTAFVAQIMSLVLMNGDILLVKAYAASDEQAGLYSSAIFLGKIAMYVASAAVAALFPMTAERQAKGEDTRSLLKKSLLFAGGITVLCSVGMNLFGGWALGLLFGDRYNAAIVMLPAVSCFVVPVTFIIILMNYLTARGETTVLVWALGIGIVAIVALVNAYHDSVSQMMYIMGGVLAAVFVCSLPGALRRPKDESARVES